VEKCFLLEKQGLMMREANGILCVEGRKKQAEVRMGAQSTESVVWGEGGFSRDAPQMRREGKMCVEGVEQNWPVIL